METPFGTGGASICVSGFAWVLEAQKQTLSLAHNSTSILANVSPLVSYTYGFASHFVVHWFFPPLKSFVSHLQSSLQALLHEEFSEVKRRRTELKAELRAASKEDRKLRKRRANLVKACNSCIRVCSSCMSPGCEAVRLQNVGGC